MDERLPRRLTVSQRTVEKRTERDKPANALDRRPLRRLAFSQPGRVEPPAQSRAMVSIKKYLPEQYRVRAKEAREQAAMTDDPAKRKRLLEDADTWERMADYEEKATLPR